MRMQKVRLLTSEITSNGSFHQGLHPLSNHDLFIVAEVVRLIRLVHDPEPVSSGVDVLIGDYFVAHDIDVPLDLGLLQDDQHTKT